MAKGLDRQSQKKKKKRLANLKKYISLKRLFEGVKWIKMNLHNFTLFNIKHLTYMKDMSKTKYMPKIGPNVAIASL